jgi:flavin reductase (DIM6/NTAB) family NADH-FMN oxidoreductase RutF
MKYKKINSKKIYRLINPGPLVLVSTLSPEKRPDIAPIAWMCPVELVPARVLLCMDEEHQSFKNILKTRKFTVSVPHVSQLNIVEETGSVSGKDADKFKLFSIKSFTAPKTGCQVPHGVIGFVECRLKKAVDVEGTAVVVGEAVYAAADPLAFNGERLVAEHVHGKALHHLGNKYFATYSDKIIK